MNWLLQATHTSIWPNNVFGWVGGIGALIVVISGLWGYAKFLSHLNGFGERLNKVEKDLAAISHQIVESDKADLKRVIDVNALLSDVRTEMLKTVADLKIVIEGLKSEIRHLGGRGAA